MRFELHDDADGAVRGGAGGGGADDGCGCAHGDAVGETLEGGDVVAGAAAEGQAGGVAEADGVRDLGFEGGDLGALLLGVVGAADLVFARVEAETLGEADGVGARDGRAETFDWWEDLLVQVVFDVGQEVGVRFEDILGGVGSFWRRERFGFVVALRDDVRHHVVDADALAAGDFAQGDLHLWHRVGVWVFFGVLAQFL